MVVVVVVGGGAMTVRRGRGCRRSSQIGTALLPLLDLSLVLVSSHKDTLSHRQRNVV